MIITVKKILALNPCKQWTKERLTKLIGKGKTPMECLNFKDVDVSDKIWVTTKFLPAKSNRKFAIWCARQCITDTKAISDYINTAERYYKGEATKEELNAADSAAYWSVYSAAYSAADWAAYSAAYWSVYSAAYSAADWAAYSAADRAVYSAACRAVYSAAYMAAALSAMRKKQLRKLKSIVKGLMK